MISDWGPAASRVVLLSLIALVAWLGKKLFPSLAREVHLPRLTLLILLGLVAVLVVVLLRVLLATHTS
ncbi:MAG: hypothetical protein ACREX3_05650 [Gammaproteobacteria bacterium]